MTASDAWAHVPGLHWHAQGYASVHAWRAASLDALFGDLHALRLRTLDDPAVRARERTMFARVAAFVAGIGLPDDEGDA